MSLRRRLRLRLRTIDLKRAFFTSLYSEGGGSEIRRFWAVLEIDDKRRRGFGVTNFLDGDVIYGQPLSIAFVSKAIVFITKDIYFEKEGKRMIPWSNNDMTNSSEKCRVRG